ncbi:MAG: sulfatase, partial [Ignavibacteria bacterium]|nr:sulfatase [Ignavibacteria bacterium]
MERREFITKLGQLGIGAAGLSMLPGMVRTSLAKNGTPPNIVFILADDMGWNQTSYIGSDFYETPNIDSIAREGIYFTQAYAPAPTCSPSRAGILTGKYPARLHLTEYIPGDQYPWAKLKCPKMVDRLPLEEITIAEMLKPLGYKSAMIGKWHLNTDKFYQPGRVGDAGSQGFDVDHPNDKPEPTDDPTNDAHHAIENTNEALKFIDSNKDQPFFLYLAHTIPHRPIMEHPDLIYKYQIKEGADKLINNPIIAAMIERMDTQIGRVLKRLDEYKLRENTIVIFSSDNGGYDKLQAQDPLRGGKSMLYEGGIRVPLAIRWPGVIKPGSKSDAIVTGTDFFPTFAEMLGIKSLPENVDGKSILPLLKQSGEFSRDAIYWHYPHYHSFGYMPGGAIREGKYKLIEFYDKSFFNQPNSVALYDVENDIGETKELSDQMPEKTKELWDKLKAWRKKVNAQ